MNNAHAPNKRPIRERLTQRRSQASRSSSQSQSLSVSHSSTRDDSERQGTRNRTLINDSVRNHKSAGCKRSRIQFSPQQDAKTLSNLGAKSGYLKQQVSGTKTWNWYYFVIRPATYLYYYQTADDDVPSGVIDLEYLDQVDYKSQVGDTFGKKQFQGSSKYSFRLCSSSEKKNGIEDNEVPVEPFELYLDPTLPKEGSEWIEALQVAGRLRGEVDDQSIQVLEGELEKANEMIADLRDQVAQSKQIVDEKEEERAQEEADYFRQMLDDFSQQTEITLKQCRTIRNSLMTTGLEEGKSPKARSSSRGSGTSRRASQTDKRNPLQNLEQLMALFEDIASIYQNQEAKLAEMKESGSEYQATLAEKDQVIRSLKRSEAKMSDLQQRLEEHKQAIKELEEKDAHIASLTNELEQSRDFVGKSKQLEQEVSSYLQKLKEQEYLLDELEKDAQYQRRMRDSAEQRAEEALAWRKKIDTISLSPSKGEVRLLGRDGADSESDEVLSRLQNQIYQRMGKFKQITKQNSKRVDLVPHSSDIKNRSIAGRKEGNTDQSKRKMRFFKSHIEEEPMEQQVDFAETSSDSTTESNEELPEGWTRVESRHYPGDFYYYNAQSGENSWDFPLAPSKTKASVRRIREEKPAAGVSKRIQEKLTRMSTNPSATNYKRERHYKSIVNLDQSSLIRTGTLRSKDVKKAGKVEGKAEFNRESRRTYESDDSEDSDDQEGSNPQEEAHNDMKSRVVQAKAIMQNYSWNNTMFTKKAKSMMNQKSRFAAWNAPKNDMK